MSVEVQRWWEDRVVECTTRTDVQRSTTWYYVFVDTVMQWEMFWIPATPRSFTNNHLKCSFVRVSPTLVILEAGGNRDQQNNDSGNTITLWPHCIWVKYNVETIVHKDKYLLKILLACSKKTIPWKWLQFRPPTIQWIRGHQRGNLIAPMDCLIINKIKKINKFRHYRI